MGRGKYRLLGQLLLDMGLVNEDQLKSALEQQQQSGNLLGRTLVDMGFVKEDDILKALGAQTGMEFIELDKMELDDAVIDMLSAPLAKTYRIVPVKFDGESITIAMSDPMNINALDDLRFMLNKNIKAVIAREKDIDSALHKYYDSRDESVEELLGEIEKKVPLPRLLETEGEIADESVLQELASHEPVVRLLNLILLQGIRDRASDIHFEPFEDEFKIRYRVDGILYNITSPPRDLSLAITSRIKVMASLDIAERRLPQDGRIALTIEGKGIDLRVSTLPTVFGESVVVRILDKSVVSLSLDQVGVADDMKESLKKIITKPNGIILSTGPTGCGKTTTLYSCLREINKIEYKIITTEDPVEYDIAGIIQVPIRSKINLNFATCLRHILRQDPDIIMVGEIRDAETAQIAIQASLTGHLVFSTLHTNDAPGAITRLINMGIEPYLITSTLEAVLAQRLVRVICNNCKEEYKPSTKELKEAGILPGDPEAKKPFFRGKGCVQCNKSGYKGRTGIYEFLIITDKLRPFIVKRSQTAHIREAAKDSGMRSLREDGLLKVHQGITTISEVARETQQYV
ncbi:MAG: type II secretion system ATPase GspE [Candidatus Omnitrophica bacterium]|nr:type II secretion system ATPase GspE [Candidatus Omnitrophota bacterium]